MLVGFLLIRVQSSRAWLVGVNLLRAVDAAEADAFRVVVVQDFELVAVEEGDDRAGEIGSEWFDQ